MSRVAKCSAGLSCLLFCRKAITKSGLQHLAPPPPTPGAPCSEPERQIRSTVDWSVSGGVLGGAEGYQPPWGSGSSCGRRYRGQLRAEPMGLWDCGTPPGVATFEPSPKE